MDKLPETIVQGTGQGRLTQEIHCGKHVLTADEPVANGGNDLGPSPYDLLLAALGACTSMTLRMYADHKNFPLDNVIVQLTHEKIHSDDCNNYDNPLAKIDKINRKIELKGALSKQQRQRLLEIANMCPVHRTLTSKILITTELIYYLV